MYAPTPSLRTTPATRRVVVLGTLLSVAVLVAVAGRTGPPAPDSLPDVGRGPTTHAMVPTVVTPAARGGGRFEAHAAGGTIVFAPDGVTLRRPAPDLTSSSVATVSLHWLGAEHTPPAAAHRLPGVVNDLRGRDRRGWRMGVPTYEAVQYRGLYRGVDARLTPAAASSGLGAMATYRLAPGADPGLIRRRSASG
jgi:hypothetical protein